MTNIEQVVLETVSEERLAEMLAGLEGVTPGPWLHSREANRPVDGRSYQIGAPNRGVAGMMYAKDAAHVKRLDPETVRSIVSELLASRLAIQAPDGWQGIKSAPSSTRVLIFVPRSENIKNLPEGTTYIAYQTPLDPPFVQSWRFADGPGKGQQAPWPTHWQPLPAAPNLGATK